MFDFSAKNSLHSDSEQLKRQKSALRLKIQEVNKDLQTGVINGHLVSLDDCDCQDYHVRQKPCKHMYRLAHELGIFHLSGTVINEPTNRNATSIKDEKLKLEQDVSLLSEDLKTFLQSVLSRHLYGGKVPLITKTKDVPQELLEQDLIVVSRPCDNDLLANHAKMNELSAIIKKNKCNIKLNQKKTAILNLLSEQYPDVYEDYIADLSFVFPSDRLLLSPRKIYSSLLPPKEEYGDDDLELTIASIYK